MAATNGLRLGAVAELEPETVKLALNLIRNENFILTEKPPLSQTCVSGWPSHKN